jgi:hypothetical protein
MICVVANEGKGSLAREALARSEKKCRRGEEHGL